MILFFSIFLFFSEVTGAQKPPENILLPPALKKRSAPQIKSIFSSLQNERHQKIGTLWWLKAQQAFLLKEKEEPFFCKTMKELSETPAFPLNKLTLIYFYESCPLSYTPEFKIDDFPEWLQEKALNSFYRRYTKFKNTGQLLEVAIQLIAYTPARELKTSYLKQAISLAKKLNDPRLTILKEQLFALHPELKSHPTFSDYIRIAHNYRKNRTFKKSIYYYRKALNSPQSSFAQKNLCFRNLKKIYKLQKRYNKYFLASKQWSQWLLAQKESVSQEIRYKNEISVAKNYWTLNNHKKALATLNALLKQSLPHFIKGEVYWLKGIIKIKLNDNQIEDGLKELSKSISLLKQSKRNQELLETVIWNQSWTLRKIGKFQDALNALNDLEKITTNPYSMSRVRFWKGETLGNLNKPEIKKAVFRNLIKKDPYGFYGLMAMKDLGVNLSIHTKKKQRALQDVKLDQQSVYLIPWLVSLEETEALQSFLKFKKKSIVKKKNKTLRDWKSFFAVQILAKQYLNIFFTFQILKERHRLYFWNNHIKLLFPLEFQKEIDIVSKRWGVPKALILAIIRQESAFHPKARSPADAFGLMQIIPSTARSLAVQIKSPYKGTKDLYDPLKNITWGSFYIKKLLKRYNDSFILSLAAYNAGGTPVKEWRASLDKTNPIEFIENIPYAETRNYVKLLIRNFVIYNHILGENPDTFPEWIFKIDNKKRKK